MLWGLWSFLVVCSLCCVFWSYVLRRRGKIFVCCGFFSRLVKSLGNIAPLQWVWKRKEDFCLHLAPNFLLWRRTKSKKNASKPKYTAVFVWRKVQKGRRQLFAKLLTARAAISNARGTTHNVLLPSKVVSGRDRTRLLSPSPFVRSKTPEESEEKGGMSTQTMMSPGQWFTN